MWLSGRWIYVHSYNPTRSVESIFFFCIVVLLVSNGNIAQNFFFVSLWSLKNVVTRGSLNLTLCVEAVCEFKRLSTRRCGCDQFYIVTKNAYCTPNFFQLEQRYWVKYQLDAKQITVTQSPTGAHKKVLLIDDYAKWKTCEEEDTHNFSLKIAQPHQLVTNLPLALQKRHLKCN